MSTATVSQKLDLVRKGNTLAPELEYYVQLAANIEALSRPLLTSRMSKHATSQNGLALLRGLEEAGKQLAKIESELRKALQAQLEAGEACEPGQLLGSIAVRTARSPEWKAEAIVQAAAAAKARREKFDALEYINRVTEATEPKSSRKAKVIDNSSDEE